jgi:hypothetical protein
MDKMEGGTRLQEYYFKIIERMEIQLKGIRGEDIERDLKKVELAMVEMYKPRVFGGKNGIEVESIVGFEDTCVLLSQHHINKDPENMRTLSFFRGLDLLRDQLKRANKKK